MSSTAPRSPRHTKAAKTTPKTDPKPPLPALSDDGRELIPIFRGRAIPVRELPAELKKHFAFGPADLRHWLAGARTRGLLLRETLMTSGLINRSLSEGARASNPRCVGAYVSNTTDTIHVEAASRNTTDYRQEHQCEVYLTARDWATAVEQFAPVARRSEQRMRSAEEQLAREEQERAQLRQKKQQRRNILIDRLSAVLTGFPDLADLTLERIYYDVPVLLGCEDDGLEALIGILESALGTVTKRMAT